MTFVWPLFLLLLPLVVLWPFIRRRHPLSVPTLQTPSKPAHRLRWSFLSPLSLSVSGVFLTITMARPQQPNLASVVETPGLDIVVAIDTSGSMGVSDYQIGGKSVSRMAASKAILKRLLIYATNQ